MVATRSKMDVRTKNVLLLPSGFSKLGLVPGGGKSTGISENAASSWTVKFAKIAPSLRLDDISLEQDLILRNEKQFDKDLGTRSGGNSGGYYGWGYNLRGDHRLILRRNFQAHIRFSVRLKSCKAPNSGLVLNFRPPFYGKATELENLNGCSGLASIKRRRCSGTMIGTRCIVLIRLRRCRRPKA